LRNILVAFIVMWIAAIVSPQTLMRFAVPIYTIGVALLIAVAMFGMIKKGARRWLNIGMVIQPSEIMKIAMPLMLAWFFQKREGMIRWHEFLVAGVLLAIPTALIIRQPDLGTAMLVLAVGFYVIFLAGLSWKVLIGLIIAGAASLPLVWSMLHDYQRHRVMTLLDPTTDPLGKGFHIIQSTIAIGSGGLTGKGWLNGTQSHLEFIPERTTDFIFAVFSEEFGLIGNIVLMVLYLLLIGRGLIIAANAPTFFARLLAGALTLMFFTYAFVNMGMVSGIIPVVGVPLPFMSYGGTAFVTLGLGVGILMSIQRHRTLVQT
jgi:rod shape determining protein RodA